MNDNAIRELMIDYVEGTISTERRAEVESFIQNSPELKKELSLIKTALDGLQNISDDDVPTHYFANFLPKLHERLDSGKVHLPWLMPEWFRLLAVSSTVSVIIFSIVLMYQTFQPKEMRSPIYSMVNDMERSEINSLVDETNEYVSSSGITRSIENVVGDVSNTNIIESKLTEDLLALEVSSYQSEHELISNLEENDIEQVLARLDKSNVR